MQCQNNLKQLGLAVSNYESQWKIFPPSSCWPPGVTPNTFDGAARRETWGMLVLPFLEQQGLYDTFDRANRPPTRPTPPRSVALPVMLCPTDSYNRQPFMGTQGAETASFGDNWAGATTPPTAVWECRVAARPHGGKPWGRPRPVGPTRLCAV